MSVPILAPGFLWICDMHINEACEHATTWPFNHVTLPQILHSSFQGLLSSPCGWVLSFKCHPHRGLKAEGIHHTPTHIRSSGESKKNDIWQTCGSCLSDVPLKITLIGFCWSYLVMVLKSGCDPASTNPQTNSLNNTWFDGFNVGIFRTPTFRGKNDAMDS